MNELTFFFVSLLRPKRISALVLVAVLGLPQRGLLWADDVAPPAAHPRAELPSAKQVAPQTRLHYAAGANGTGMPLSLGYNLADVSSVGELNTLPATVKGLVWLDCCQGANDAFIKKVKPFIGNTKLFGFYLMDEPDPTGKWGKRCSAADLKAESDWIHAHVPGAKTFIILMNMGTTDTQPTFANTYNPANTGIDLFGLDPYPCKKEHPGGYNLNVISASVTAAASCGIPVAQIVPVYQAFGGGGYKDWTMPTAAQEQEILAAWGAVVPNPVFDFTYAWGRQQKDTALESCPAQQAVFAAHNRPPADAVKPDPK